MSRLILVSNRLPFTVFRRENGAEIVRSAGGLVTALGPVHERRNGLWVGTMDLAGEEQIASQMDQHGLLVVPVPEQEATRHYEGYSNRVLWPLCHYLLDRLQFDSRDFEAYRRVNERFADAIVSRATDGDTIWIHDYHLMLLPTLLRKRLPGASIGFFLHIPFPSSEVFRILPRSEEILEGLLGANVIGLHTWDYARHLISSFRRILGVEFNDDWVRVKNRDCSVGVFPLGVDVDHLRETALSPAVQKHVVRLREQVGDRRVILGVDRLDYTKGIPLRLRAYRRLLETQEEWRDKAILLQLAVPSRSSMSTYRALKDEVERLVGNIDGQFAQAGVTPIQYLYRSVPADELAAMYRLADVMFVSPTRDGMNLVAKEYVASRYDDTGVLVLSEFAGAASEMGEALLHNPWNIDGTAQILDQALRLDPIEVQQRMSALRRRLAANNVHRWVNRFLAQLTRFSQSDRVELEDGEDKHSSWLRRVGRSFAKAERALLALDYDGTLKNFATTPEEAAPTPEIIELLAGLVSLRNVDVLIVSGRDQQTLDRWLGKLPIHLVAEHGFRWRHGGGNSWEGLLPSIDMSWKDSVRDILEEYTARSVGAFVEEKPASMAWHYRQVEPGFATWQARELAQHLSESFSNSPLEVLHGHQVIEVRPQGFDKGRAFRLASEKIGPYDFVLAAGDDRTDEDLFRVLPAGSWAVKIGPGETGARFRIEGPPQLRSFLRDVLREFRDSPD